MFFSFYKTFLRFTKFLEIIFFFIFSKLFIFHFSQNPLLKMYYKSITPLFNPYSSSAPYIFLKFFFDTPFPFFDTHFPLFWYISPLFDTLVSFFIMFFLFVSFFTMFFSFWNFFLYFYFFLQIIFFNISLFLFLPFFLFSPW